jgi:hypothetical protein
VYDRVTVEQDIKFVQMLDETTSQGDSILTLPYVSYPESSTRGVTYHHNIPLFSKNNLNISFGATKGSEGDKKYAATDKLVKLVDILQVARSSQYKWLLFDTRGYGSQTWAELNSELVKKCNQLDQVESYRLLVEVSTCHF